MYRRASAQTTDRHCPGILYLVQRIFPHYITFSILKICITIYTNKYTTFRDIDQQPLSSDNKRPQKLIIVGTGLAVPRNLAGSTPPPPPPVVFAYIPLFIFPIKCLSTNSFLKLTIEHLRARGLSFFSSFFFLIRR